MFPALSMLTAEGALSCALVAGPSSPLNPEVPVPAMVVMMPVDASILRIRLSLWPATYRFPAPSMVRPYGPSNLARIALPPSPPNPPATVVMTPRAVEAVTGSDAGDMPLVPTPLVAETETVYVAPLESPVIVHAKAPVVLHVAPPGEAVAV